jgi:hypothetical protein
VSEGEAALVSGGEGALVSGGEGALANTKTAMMLSAGILGVMGMMGYFFGMGERIMCTKAGCRGHGSLVKSVSLILCSTHEAALDRVPEIRKLSKEKYRADVRTSAYAHGGDAVNADRNAMLGLEIEDTLLEAALAWSKTPDAAEVPADVIDAPRE